MNGTGPQPRGHGSAIVDLDDGLCLDCGYALRDLPECRCPECGRGFDPDDPATFGRPDIPALDRMQSWGTAGVLIVVVAYSIGRLVPGAAHVPMCTATPCAERGAVLLEAPIILVSIIAVAMALLGTRLHRPVPRRVRGWIRNAALVGGMAAVGSFVVVLAS